MSLKTAALATAAASKAPSAEKTAASSSLKTSLEHTHHLLNYAELPITAAAYSTRQSLLLVCDGRSLRVYSGTRCLRSAQLPATLHGAPVRTLHYNSTHDHFIAVYASSEAQVIDVDLSMHESGTLKTEQLTILGSAWSQPPLDIG